MNAVSAVAEVLFWSFAALIAYAYIGYPLCVWLFGKMFGRWAAPAGGGGELALPRVSLVIAAYNEEEMIGARLRNALESDYPADLLEIVVASDGSDDLTPDIVRNCHAPNVRLLDYAERRGKSATLNAAVPEVSGDVLIFSDANTFFDPGAIRSLVRWFANPAVGVVCGRLILTDPATGTNVDSLYWKYETFLKKCEGRLGALLGANGAIYAMRRGAYADIPAGTLVDDFVIPLLAKQRTGCEIVYDPAAVAEEESPATVRSEFRRRSRIGAGGYQSIPLLWRLLSVRRGWVAYTFFSHKILRWLCPFFMLGALAANAALLGSDFYRLVLGTQALFYAAAVAAPLTPRRPKALKILHLAGMFTSMNLALLVGFFRWLRGTGSGVWHRTARSGAMPSKSV
jgi:cellulose synthase/poly-beta-1,6-N-acetylglucosamine synthase-like glycosyltransferase